MSRSYYPCSFLVCGPSAAHGGIVKASSSALLAFRPRISWASILIPVVTVALVVNNRLRLRIV